MLTSGGPEPPIQRLLASLAATLTDHSVRGAAGDPRRLLPCLDARWADPALGVAAALALGGQLSEASAGVLLLSSSTLDTKRAIGLGQYMAAGEAVLAPGCPEQVVTVRWRGQGLRGEGRGARRGVLRGAACSATTAACAQLLPPRASGTCRWAPRCGPWCTSRVGGAGLEGRRGSSAALRRWHRHAAACLFAPCANPHHDDPSRPGEAGARRRRCSRQRRPVTH